MSDYEPKEGAGNLFRNDRQENDKQPSHRGEMKIEGKVFRLSAWVRESKKGEKYFSIQATPKDETPKRHSDVGIDDAVPF
jgi:uncharacterized protein (DUF736 family)